MKNVELWRSGASHCKDAPLHSKDSECVKSLFVILRKNATKELDNLAFII